MKQYKNILFLLTLYTFFFSTIACKKDAVDEFHSYPNDGNDTTWTPTSIKADIVNPFLPELSDSSAIDSFVSETGGTIKLKDSSEIEFPANSYKLVNGIVARGKITVAVKILRKIGEFIKYDKPTTSNGAFLSTKAHFDIKLLQNGQPVAVNPAAKISFRIKDAAPNPRATYFQGRAIPFFKDSLFTWLPSNNGKVSIWESDIHKPIGYEIETSKPHWFSVGFLLDSIGTKKQSLNVLLPLNYTNKNTVVYAIQKSQKVVVSLIPDGRFRSFYALGIPNRTEVTVVAISKINGQLYWDTANFNLKDDLIVRLKPNKITLKDLRIYLDNL